jgi:hypothetical protein
VKIAIHYSLLAIRSIRYSLRKPTMPILPFGEWKPDLMNTNGDSSQLVQNVVPRADGYGPFGSFLPFSGPLAEGNDSFTKVLLHFDGLDASTTFTDNNAGGSAHAWRAAGNAQIDTAQFKFGGSSGLFDGSADYVSTPDSSDFTLSSKVFTIECWIRPAADGTDIYFGGQAATPIAVERGRGRCCAKAPTAIAFKPFLAAVPRSLD